MGRDTTRSIGMDQTLSRRPEGGGDGSGYARLGRNDCDRRSVNW